jgi:hypothetical protein
MESSMLLPFTHEVWIGDEPMKRFRSLKEAKWFCENKTDARIVKLKVEKVVEKPLWELVGDALF